MACKVLKAACVLILCEKPSVARDFAEALGCGGRRGYYQNETVTITYCIGHLFELAKLESYHPSYRVWDATKLPIIPDKFRYRPILDAASQTGVVLSLISEALTKEVILKGLETAKPWQDYKTG
jgi:DNA topoisomerase-3